MKRAMRTVDERRNWLLRLGWALVAATSLVVFIGTISFTRQFVDALPVRIAEGLQMLGWSQSIYFWFTIATIAPLFLASYITGALIFWLRPHDRMVQFTSIFLMTFGAANSFSPAKEYLGFVAVVAPGWFNVANFVAGMLSFGLFAVFFATFPDGKFVPRWMIWISLEGFLLSLAWNLFPGVVGDFSGPYGPITVVAALVMLGGGGLAQVWRYRYHATATQRQQTKWIAYSMACIVMILVIPTALIYGISSPGTRLSVILDAAVSVINLVFVLVPISIGIAILRYRLWDIDIIIRRTLQYSALTGLLLLIYFGTVVSLQSVFRAITGSESLLAVAASTLAIAALFNPLRTRIQSFIDHRFFRKKYDAEQAITTFATVARDEVDMDKLAEALLAVVANTMQPENVALCLRILKLNRTRKG